MKPLAIATASLTLALVASAPLAAPAQRGAPARGSSFSAHSAPSFHSSFTPSSSARSFSGPAYHYSGPAFAAPRIASAPRPALAPRYAVAPSAARTAFYTQRRPPVDRRRYAPRVAGAYPYPFIDYGWLDSSYYDDTSNDIAAEQPIYPDPNLYQQQPEPAPPPAPTYAPRPRPAAPPAEEEAVTLIFKDGRPSEQIHNYMLTRKMLYVRDQHRRDIPVDQLDLTATEKANQANGVEFALPAGN